MILPLQAEYYTIIISCHPQIRSLTSPNSDTVLVPNRCTVHSPRSGQIWVGREGIKFEGDGILVHNIILILPLSSS